MDVRAAMADFNAQLRQRPAPDGPGSVVEYDGDVVRLVSPAGWSGVVWSDLTELTAEAAISRQLDRFAGQQWEWKLYSYDSPADLADRLRHAGLTAEPPETVLLAEAAELNMTPVPPPGIRLVEVTDEAGLDLLVRLHQQVFGGDHARFRRNLLARLRQAPETTVPVLAIAEGGQTVAAARLEFVPGTAFAGLWGGATLPEWRGKGVFRALVAFRAAVAAKRGVRYLQVDAMPTSRPILERLGFVAVATVAGWTASGGDER